mmetsp:Transcript_29558/g.78203  ORF Transcript_29558/g.78203 Transcript_29558/m.78203 type:complete len:168 (-) Transcript_29558:166-669(-)
MEQHLNVPAEQAELIERTVKLMRLGVRSQISDSCIPEPKDPLVRDVDQLIRILDQDGDDDVEEHNSEDGDAVSCGSSEVARVSGGRRTPQSTKLRDPLGRKSFVRQEESSVLRRLPSLVIPGVEEPILSEDYAALTSEQNTVQVNAEFPGEVRSNSWWCASLCISEP